MGEDSGDKTEEPTPHKLREARNKGQIAKSQEITSASLLFIAFFTFKAVAFNVWQQLVGLTQSVFELLASDFSTAIVTIALINSVKALFLCIGPIFAATFASAIIIESLQTGFLFTLEPLKPKFSNLNPIQGAKKFFSLKQYVELIKSIIKMSLVIWILYSVIREEYFVISQAQARNLWILMGFVGNLVIKIITRVGILYLCVALFDYFYQKFEFIKSMKMSKKEIKEEYKRLEGDPIIKQRQREAARSMSQGRQMGAVPGADVVVTNPIHIAIALQYDPNTMQAPVVLAKGKRLIASEIRSIATNHDIPIVENPHLAQMLFKTTAVGQGIPPDYFRLVAEVLAFVYHLKKKHLR